MSDKVFCSRCRHLSWEKWGRDFGIPDSIRCESNPDDSALYPAAVFADPFVKNVNNDCGEFEKKPPPPPPPDGPPNRVIDHTWKRFWKWK